MSKQPSTGMKKILAILFTVFFVVSLTAVSVDARGGHGGWSGHGGWGGWGEYPYWGYGYPYGSPYPYYGW